MIFSSHFIHTFLDIISKEGIAKCRELYLGKKLTYQIEWLTRASTYGKSIYNKNSVNDPGETGLELKTYARKLVERLINSGVRVVAFDMDQCIIGEHSRYAILY